MRHFIKISLKDEVNLIWSSDKNYRFVRVLFKDFLVPFGMPEEEKNFIELNGDILVGYADLRQDVTPSSIRDGKENFQRRIFILRDGDLENFNGNKCPIEGVDPRSLEPGVMGISPIKKSQVAVRIPPELLWKLNSYTQKSGVSQTETVIKALNEHLKLSEKLISNHLLEKTIIDLDQRVKALESKNN